ncbi:hypothetical protein BY996DRAFT_4573149, partial [Phakopsora pachyrhizi]
RTLTDQEYHYFSDDFLQRLSETLENLIESDNPEVNGWDVDYSSGVLTLSVGNNGTYVINKQPPNKQIWLSSPSSGPKRFDFDKDTKVWFYSRDGTRLKELLFEEIKTLIGNDTFSTLFESSDEAKL